MILELVEATLEGFRLMIPILVWIGILYLILED